MLQLTSKHIRSIPHNSSNCEKGGTGWIVKISPVPLTHTRSEGHWICSGWDSGVPKPSSYLTQILVVSSWLLCLPLHLKCQKQKQKDYLMNWLWTKAETKICILQKLKFLKGFRIRSLILSPIEELFFQEEQSASSKQLSFHPPSSFAYNHNLCLKMEI